MKVQRFNSNTRIVLKLIIGLTSLIIGLSLAGLEVSKIKTGFVRKATVLQIESISGKENDLYRPVLQFIDHRNKLMHYRPEYRAFDWYKGETVLIHYTQNNFDDISILSWWSNFGIPLILCCVALVSLLFAGGEYWAVGFFKTLKYPESLT